MPRPIPEFGTPLPPDSVNPELPMYPVYGVTPGNEYIPLKVAGDGTLATSATLTGTVTIGSLGVADRSSFTYGGSLEQPVGGVFNDSGVTLASGTTGALRLTSARGLHTNLRDSSGDELLGQALSAGSIPVVLASDQSSIPVSISGTIPVSGTVAVSNFPATQPISAVSLPLPTGAATSTNQTTQQVALNAIETNTSNIPPLGQALAAGSVPVVLTAAQLSTLTPLSTVTVTQATGTNLHTVVDNFPATQPISGSVSVNNFPASQVVSQATGTNLHTVVDNFPATQTVAGTVTANAGTGTFNENLMEVGGTAFGLGQAVSVSSLPVVIASDQSPIPVTGTITTSPNVNVHDGAGNSISSTGTSLNVDVTNTVTVAGTITANAGTGTFAISAASLPLPTGAATSALQTSGNSILSTIASNTSQLAGTQPVSIASNVTVVQPTGTNLHTVVDNFPATQPISGSVSVSNFPATQPISGTVAVSNFPGTVAITSLPPLPAGGNTIGTVLANTYDGAGNPIGSTGTSLNVNVTNPSSLDTVNQGNPNTLANAWPVELSDGTNLLGTSTHPVRIDPTGTTTQPISGSVSISNFPATQPVSIASPVTVAQATGSNLHTVVDSGAIVATPPALPAAAAFGQAVIATTGTAVQLAAAPLVNGIVVTANGSNVASIVVGLSGVTNVTNGSGNGYVLAAGASIGIAAANANSIWINGTSADAVSYVGS